MKISRLLSILVLLTTLFGFGRANTQGLAKSETPIWTARVQGNTGTPPLRVPSGEPMTPEMLIQLLPKLSGGVAELLATQLGVTQLAGKDLSNLRPSGLDNPVDTDDLVIQNDPSIAVNPVNDSIVAIAYQYDSDCIVSVSYDGGNTFNYNDYAFLPLQSGDACGHPVVRFSPNGVWAYYVYLDIDTSTATSNVVMTTAPGFYPLSIGSPTVVISGSGSFLDAPWVDVAYYDQTGMSNGAVYVTATEYTGSGGCNILFNASTDYGATWDYGSFGSILAAELDCDPTITGARPIGNPSTGYVTVCWYDSESDGSLTGKFDIDCWTDNNFGSSSSFSFTPVNDRKYELPDFLGPLSSYHVWWYGMWPSLAVDNTGLLYIAFAADPNSNPYDVESGNVYVARGFPYTSTAWSNPITVGSGGQAQGFPTVTARCDTRTNKCYSYVAYFDHLNKNKLYHVVYRKGTRPFSASSVGSLGFGPKIRITDGPSWSDDFFIGTHIDSSVISGRRYHVTWTDRADVSGTYDLDDDVMHDMFVP